MVKYTFTFDKEEEKKFKQILERLDPAEYSVVEDVKLVDPANPNYCDRTMVIDMDPDAALTFRLGMKYVKIRRERTEEELAEEKANEDRHKVKITVVMPTK